MNPNLIAAILVVIILIIFLVKNKKKISAGGVFPLFYVFMLRSKLGLKTMDKVAKVLREPLKVIGFIGVIIGFIGMIFVCYEIIYNTYMLIFKPAIVSGVQLVLPFEAKGVFYVPFIYWILSIFIVAGIHEFSHGLFGRVYKIPLLSTGMAILGIIIPIIPAAFVEPDEKKFKKFNKKAKLTMLAAGPFANIVLGVIVLLLLLPFSSFIAGMQDYQGIEITQIAENGPAEQIGMSTGLTIIQIDDSQIKTVDEFKKQLQEKKSGDIIKIKTDQATYDMKLQEQNNEAYMGVFVKQKMTVKEGKSETLVSMLNWIAGLFMWVYLLSLGIGLFNLLPIGPLDGGKMLNEVFGHNKKGKIMFKTISLLFFLMILVNVFSGFF